MSRVFAAEKEHGIGVPGYARWIESLWPFAVFVNRVEHQLHAIEPQQHPIEWSPGRDVVTTSKPGTSR